MANVNKSTIMQPVCILDSPANCACDQKCKIAQEQRGANHTKKNKNRGQQATETTTTCILCGLYQQPSALYGEGDTSQLVSISVRDLPTKLLERYRTSVE